MQEQQESGRASVGARLPKKLRNALEAAAGAERRSISNLLQLLVEEGLERRSFWPYEDARAPKGRQ